MHRTGQKHTSKKTVKQNRQPYQLQQTHKACGEIKHTYKDVRLTKNKEMGKNCGKHTVNLLEV